MKNHLPHPAFRIVLYYFVFGIAWIALSDRLLDMFIADPRLVSELQTYKGWTFVVASTLLMYAVIGRELRTRERTVADLKQSEEKYRTLIETSNDAVFMIDAETRIVIDANKKAADLLGLPRDRILGMRQQDIHPPDNAAQCDRIYGSALETGEFMSDDICVYHHLSGKIPVEVSGTVVERGGRKIIQAFFRDITKRKEAEDLAQERLQRLAALHAIDLIISSNLDLRVTLTEFITLVSAQLNTDAADVLLLNRHTQTLEYAAGQGFKTDAISRTRLRMGEGIAGAAAMEHRSISIPDLRDPAAGFLRAPELEREGCIAYYAVPLIAKGRVKGVLEAWYRTPTALHREQQEHLEALAAKAAIAIDNAELFNELQRSNTELTLAYDATLEGWARALDLRSKATERHTERVTGMTLRLARALNISDEALVHVRRGSLLHDIGKIGVPDSILTKPGPLTDNEWKIMRQHPTFAFDMLRPIAYLQPALDIPFSHHEHYDGTGYPRGLKGEQIPLAARIFSVVDTWDAMTSTDRPYREPEEKAAVRERIRALAGTQLDPVVVETFLSLEW